MKALWMQMGIRGREQDCGSAGNLGESKSSIDMSIERLRDFDMIF